MEWTYESWLYWKPRISLFEITKSVVKNGMILAYTPEWEVLQLESWLYENWLYWKPRSSLFQTTKSIAYEYGCFVRTHTLNSEALQREALAISAASP